MNRHTSSKWIRIVTAALLAVIGMSGIVTSWNAGHAQERYFRYKYGHFRGTSLEVKPIDFSGAKGTPSDPALLPDLLDACKAAYDVYPENYYFPSYAAHQALIVALKDTNEVDFRRHFGAAEYWCRIAHSLNPYDIEVCYVLCRILWEKGEKNAALDFWRNTVVAREFWNPYLRSHLIYLSKKAGKYSLAAKEARYLRSKEATAAIRDFQKRRSAIP